MSTVSHTVEYQTLIKREEESVYMQLEKDSKIYYYVKKVTRCSAVCLICSLLCKYFGLGYVYWYWEKIILEGYWKNVLTMVYPEERNWRGREIVFILHFFYLNFSNNICILVFNFKFLISRLSESRIIGYLNSYSFCVLKYIHNIHICSTYMY